MQFWPKCNRANTRGGGGQLGGFRNFGNGTNCLIICLTDDYRKNGRTNVGTWSNKKKLNAGQYYISHSVGPFPIYSLGSSLPSSVVHRLIGIVQLPESSTWWHSGKFRGCLCVVHDVPSGSSSPSSPAPARSLSCDELPGDRDSSHMQWALPASTPLLAVCRPSLPAARAPPPGDARSRVDNASCLVGMISRKWPVDMSPPRRAPLLLHTTGLSFARFHRMLHWYVSMFCDASSEQCCKSFYMDVASVRFNHVMVRFGRACVCSSH